MDVLLSVARFVASSSRANLNCNRDQQNSKSAKDEIAELGITWIWPPNFMKTHNNLYTKLCSRENLQCAFLKARKRKAKKWCVQEFEKHLDQELLALHQELATLTYQPRSLKKFIIRDPKTRAIHASHFRDRVVYHALVNILEPIFEKIFIYDSYASRKNKGTHKAVQRFDQFKRKIAKNGMLVKNPHTSNNVIGYVLKADIRHYFDTVDHEILLHILKKKITEEKVIWLVKKILNNFESSVKRKGMPLGNLTSQFFANVYLNELDYFVKHKLKEKYYIRYVDDFVILHRNKEVLKKQEQKIKIFLEQLKLQLHPDKSKIIALRNGLTFLGYRNFYHFRLLRKSNLKKFEKNFAEKKELYKESLITKEKLLNDLQGWFGYAQWADTYQFRKRIMRSVS